MNRSILERELKKLGITMNGWMPVFQCDTCKRRWEPFDGVVGSAAPTARFDHWKCPNQCNATAHVSREVQTALPKCVVINDIPGMIFDDEDLPEFHRYVQGMDATVIPDRN